MNDLFFAAFLIRCRNEIHIHFITQTICHLINNNFNNKQEIVKKQKQTQNACKKVMFEKKSANKY